MLYAGGFSERSMPMKKAKKQLKKAPKKKVGLRVRKAPIMLTDI
jgi:hypothetical protein